MVISICAPCKNRASDLQKVLPSWIAAANESPPVEIAVLNYNSTDNLDEVIGEAKKRKLNSGSYITYVKDVSNKYYHSAHACNLCILISSGEYFLRVGADAHINKGFMSFIRENITKHNYVWMGGQRRYRGIIVCKRQEFIDIGGYDERIEFYGSEDVDLNNRLRRSGGKTAIYPLKFITPIKTGKKKKLKNYRPGFSSQDMKVLGRRVLRDNNSNNVIVANENIEWGKLTCQ